MNAVYVELLHRAGMRFADVFYYRDRSFEVDFIVAKDGVVEELYQVCYDMSGEKTRKREITSILQGAKKFHCNQLTILTFDEQETIKEDENLKNRKLLRDEKSRFSGFYRLVGGS